ncbi:lysoplasmalogenase [Salinibacterium sp. SYSU T00001]|uniref:lysoplasmalogenase n=1 Tax=Homoserinimonas sedimenticola TaxID=2986805 RepID=UPI00223565BA|nr:lysoplasmalogenase [Salinibacterium sedimenticola]MCW4386738.1 lysoplasmalogenase [Salinibacterium sedimenticola]
MRFSPRARARLAFLPYAVVAVLHLLALVATSMGADVAATDVSSKALLMPALLLGFLVGVPRLRSRAAALGVVAIISSWVGDLALMVPGTDAFLLGLAAFFIAHAALLLLMVFHLGVRRLPLAAFAYLGWWIALVALLAPHAAWLVWPLAAYGVVLGLMAMASTRASALVVLGGFLFAVSDSMLGVDRFVPSIQIWQADVVIMLAYTLAQGLVAFGAVEQLRRAREEASAAEHASGGPTLTVREDALH